MFFNHPSVRAYLVKRGHVYTLRDHLIREGRHRLVHGSYFKNRRIGFGIVRLVKDWKNLSPSALQPYVRSSGLKSVRSWMGAFQAFSKGQRPHRVFLFRVDLVGKDSPSQLKRAAKSAKGDRPWR